MIAYKELRVLICAKIWHIHKIGERAHNNFTETYGEVPVFHFNEISGKIESVVNNRGRAYAARNRLKYKHSPKYTIKNKY